MGLRDGEPLLLLLPADCDLVLRRAWNASSKLAPSLEVIFLTKHPLINNCVCECMCVFYVKPHAVCEHLHSDSRPKATGWKERLAGSPAANPPMIYPALLRRGEGEVGGQLQCWICLEIGPYSTGGKAMTTECCHSNTEVKTRCEKQHTLVDIKLLHS